MNMVLLKRKVVVGKRVWRIYTLYISVKHPGKLLGRPQLEVLLPSENIAGPTSLARKNCRNEKNCRQNVKISRRLRRRKISFCIGQHNKRINGVKYKSILSYSTQFSCNFIEPAVPTNPLLFWNLWEQLFWNKNTRLWVDLRRANRKAHLFLLQI